MTYMSWWSWYVKARLCKVGILYGRHVSCQSSYSLSRLASRRFDHYARFSK